MAAEVRFALRSLSVGFSFGLESTTAVFTCIGLPGFFARLIFWIIVPALLVALRAAELEGDLPIVQRLAFGTTVWRLWVVLRDLPDLFY